MYHGSTFGYGLPQYIICGYGNTCDPLLCTSVFVVYCLFVSCLGDLFMLDFADFHFGNFDPKSKRRYFGAHIPWDWLSKVCHLKNLKALPTALVIWHRSKLTGKLSVKLTSKDLVSLNVNRQAKYRALAAMEGAGLIKVERKNRKNPTVTILV